MDYLAFARVELGLTSEEFFALTPRTFAAYREQWEARKRAENIQWAMLRVDVINGSFHRPRDPVKLTDLVPNYEEPQAELRRSGRRKSRKRIAADLRSIFSAMANR